MDRIRHTRRFVALLALASLLFMQLAVAAYACPNTAAAQVVAAAGEGMQGCHDMDTFQPNLCQAHDQAGNQSLDKPPFPDVQPFIPAALQLEVRNAETRRTQARMHPGDILLKRATAPPHAIDHCCFRI